MEVHERLGDHPPTIEARPDWRRWLRGRVDEIAKAESQAGQFRQWIATL
jgi:hypothetical protein